MRVSELQKRAPTFFYSTSACQEKDYESYCGFLLIHRIFKSPKYSDWLAYRYTETGDGKIVFDYSTRARSRSRLRMLCRGNK
jgi:hypothetical protein